MATVNLAPKTETPTTHGGALAENYQKPFDELQRTVNTCLLFEDSHYESGQARADRITDLVGQCEPDQVMRLARNARRNLYLRHVPLWVMASLAYQRRSAVATPGFADTLAMVVMRPDEAAEFLAMYWCLNSHERGKPAKLTHQIKVGLAKAMTKFDAYQLAKWDRAKQVKLRDVLFLTHANPKDADQAVLWKQLVEGTLPAADTWEVGLSTGKGSRETFERLLREERLGYIALLANLRNMLDANVDRGLIRDRLQQGAARSRVLPWQFLAAMKAAPSMVKALDNAMVTSAKSMSKITGRTLLVIDTSGSMQASLSRKSTLNRLEAAGALAALARERCEDVEIYATAGNDMTRVHATAEVPAYHGMALASVFAGQDFVAKLGGGGIFLTQCMGYIEARHRGTYDQVLVFTDEQDCDNKLDGAPSRAKKLGARNYIMNVESYEHGIGADNGWTKISGFSEAVLDYIVADQELVPQQ